MSATLSTGTLPTDARVAARTMSEGLTPTNLIGNAVATIVVAKWEKAVDERRLQQALDGKASKGNLVQS